MTVLLSQAISGYQLDAAARHLSRHTLADYNNTFAKFMDYLDDDPTIDSISSTLVKSFLASRSVSKKTVLNYHTGLSALWAWAVDADLVEINILHTVQRPRPEKRVINELSREQVEAMFSALDRSRDFSRPGQRSCSVALPNSDRNRAILILFLDTGIRVSELCELTIDRCDLRGRKIIVFGKGAKERQIPISARTAQVIWKYLSKRSDARMNDFLFVTRENLPITRKNCLDMLTDLGERAGVPNVHPHRLRHTFAINYLRNGGDVYTLQDILGHTTLDMVKNYLHIARTDVAASHRKASPVANWRL